MLNINDTAPKFSLISSDTNKISLSDFSGKKVLLLFFPFAFTSVCTEEMCETQDHLSQYNALGVEVLGISVDSPFTLAEFKKTHTISFPLLSDFNKVVSPQYGAWYEDFVFGLKGVSKRAAFLIDEDGKIIYQEVLENAGEKPNFQNIQNLIQAS